MDAVPPTVTGLLLAQADREQPGLLFEDRRWTWREHVGECARYAAALRGRRAPGRPFHVGVLADNVPEFSFLLGGCAFAGAERFGCHVIDGFGSTEGGVAVSRSPDAPPGALGRLSDGVAVLDPETGRPCPPARFSPGGELLNPAEAVGELVNTAGPGMFAGYYNDAEADASRMRGGRYWSGDLAYADADGFCWFAGRAGQWLRVDGENLGTAPIERVLLRHPAIAAAAVYGVPDVNGPGDQVMACVVLRDGATLTPAELGAFLAGQGDLGGKQQPRFVRVAREMPRTATFKVITRLLAAERWRADGDPVWWRPDGRAPEFAVLGPERAAALDAGLRAGSGRAGSVSGG